MQKTLGGDRLGAGKKMKVDLHGYERSTHDMGYLWRSTMACGTLVPFMVEVALPGDTFDINLDVDLKTHPTIGPLFGSYKIQLDVFQAPIRLYQGQLHNNKLGIGLNMANIKLPIFTLYADPDQDYTQDIDNSQINPSCLYSYLGIRGIGMVNDAETNMVGRDFNGIPLLAYWDIYKNYYANKQEEVGYVIHTPTTGATTGTVVDITVDGGTLTQWPTLSTTAGYPGAPVIIENSGVVQDIAEIVFVTDQGTFTGTDVLLLVNIVGVMQNYTWTGPMLSILGWTYIGLGPTPAITPTPTSFPLSDIDGMREDILSETGTSTAFDIGNLGRFPYTYLLAWATGQTLPWKNTQEGLGLKTYQSDLFNNWLSTDWIDGTGGINDITAIDTSGGSFNIDTLNLSKKVYDMLNRIAVSGGSYDDWLDAVYTHDRYTRAETPIYHGGLIRELVFQEVVSNTSTTDAPESQPLGTLAGKGIMAGKKKGGQVRIKVDEPSYIMGIISLTPRIDYSQGNKWDTGLLTMDDLHKPALDEIGFQELITEQMAWWTTNWETVNNVWAQKSAGKQPAWINYMTNVNQTRGNFAISNNEMFMTLNRRYEWNGNQNNSDMTDLTTYIDPSKFNFIFAQTAIDAQNFWAQIAVDITARRKMSAKLMPNL